MSERAVISDDGFGCYRYALWRDTGVLGTEGTVLFVMLNPSTADADTDDPTIRRCIGFARRWGYARLAVGNLYAYRATDPSELYRVQGPVGEFGGVPAWSYAPGNMNDHWLEKLAKEADLIVAAWGADPGPISWRPDRALDLIGECVAVGLTKTGAPRHPLYVKADAERVPFNAQKAAA